MITPALHDIIHTTHAGATPPEVSVITPAYNPGTDLAATVASLNAQSCQAFEWILVDDASDPLKRGPFDDAIKASNFPVTLVRHRTNWRQGQARNTGISLARGHYLKFLDADDALDPDHLTALLAVAPALNTRKVLPFAPTQHVFLTSGRKSSNLGHRTLDNTSEAQLARLLIAPFLHHCGVLFPRSLIETLGGYDGALVTDEDGDLLIRTLLAGWRFDAVESVRYVYRHHDTAPRVSHDDRPEKLTARQQVTLSVARHYDANQQPMPDAVRDALCKRLDAIAVRCWNSYPQLARSMLAEARALNPAYPRSGSIIERSVRTVVGVGPARRLVSAVRAAKGVAFHGP